MSEKQTKKVRVYDIQSGWVKWKVKEDVPEEAKNLVAEEKLIVIEGPKGVIVSDYPEGVHWLHEHLDENTEIELREAEREEVGDDGKMHVFMSIFPKARMTMTIRQIVDDCTFEEVELKDAVRIFGSRLDTNWRLLKESMTTIGLDLNDYDTNRGR